MSTAARADERIHASRTTGVTRLDIVRPVKSSGPRGRTAAEVPRAVPILAAVLGVTFIVWSAWSGSITLYGDARAHLNVARHVTDGITPGLTQLGSVWLPLPHLLMVPLVAIDGLWHSALAGAIVSGASFVYSAVRLFALVDDLFEDRRAAWVAFAVYVTNLNLLYLQTTSLTEPVLLAFFVGAVYHLSRWMRSLSHRDLFSGATMTLCATLTRYDGWFVLVVALAVVAIWSRLRERRRDGVQANIFLFGAVSAYGISLWVLYNLVIFQDPLYFIHSTFSAQSQQNALQQVGSLITRGALGESALTYTWAVIDVAGIALVALGALGTIALLAGRGIRSARVFAVTLLLLSPIIFNVLSLWGGQSTIRVPERPPHGMWNVRYGLMALPFLAVGAAALVHWSRALTRAVATVIAVGVVVMAWNTPITLADGRTGTSSAAGGRPELAAAYLSSHYRGGRVLADESSSAPFIYASKLHLSEFVTIGYHPYYEDALADPAGHVEWVVAYEGDAVRQTVSRYPDRFKQYVVAIQDGRALLLHRERPGLARH